MLTVVCVLKTGGEYSAHYVKKLMDGIKNNLTIEYRFICLSDIELDFCETLPLLNDYPGWWSKLELFRFKDKTLYFDLDTVINGSLDEIASFDHHFTMLQDFQPYGRDLMPGVYGSGVMAWQGDFSYLLDEFTTAEILNYNTTGKWGDQGWIRDKLNQVPDTFQTLFPAMFASHKWHPKQTRLNASVVCYHGKPRPHETGWIV